MARATEKKPAERVNHFVILVAIAQTVLDVGALLALVLNSVVLSLFPQSEVIRTVIQWRERGNAKSFS